MSAVPASFEDLLAPMSAEVFFDQYWEQAVCQIRGLSSTRFSSWVTEEEIRDFLAYAAPNLLEYDVNVVRAGSSPNEDPVDLLEMGSPVRARKAHRFFEAYAEGFTLVLRLLARRMGRVETICRYFEKHFCCPVYPALYLTPPESRGFAPHWDEDDVYVFQMHGSKMWSIRANAAPLCRTSGEVGPGRLNELPIVLETTLQQGDLLYIPRGFVHEAKAQAGAAAHLTVSVSHPRVVDWVKSAFSIASREMPELRRSLPLGRWDAPEMKDAISEEARALLARTTLLLDGHSAARALHASLIEKLSPAFGTRPLASIERWLQRSSDGMELRLRDDAVVAFDETTKELTVPAGTLHVPDDIEAPLRHLIDGEAVTSRALSSPEGKQLLKALLGRGLVEVDPRPNGTASKETFSTGDLTRLSLPLSILDFGHPSATYHLAPRAEKLGYARYWLGEHHGPRQCASPLQLTAIVAGLTRRIRVGPAGVCLPLHGALRVAQQARLLELSFAHRIDVGVCKGMSLPPFVRRELTGPDEPWSDFNEQLRRLSALLSASPETGGNKSGANPSSPQRHQTNASSADKLAEFMLATGGSGALWVLGVSPDSAESAGRIGAYFCFSEHHNGARFRAAEVLDRYRQSFRPGPRTNSPRTAIVLSGICGESQKHARRLFEPIRATFSTPTLLDGPEVCAEQVLAHRATSTADEVIILDAFFARQDLSRAEIQKLRQLMFEALAELLRLRAPVLPKWSVGPTSYNGGSESPNPAQSS